MIEQTKEQLAQRVIKFRAWDGEKMHNDVSPWRWDFVISNAWHRCEKSTGSGMFGSGGDTAEMLVPAIRFKVLMQFTGKTFPDGTEIYEGDLIGMGNYVYVVKFEDGKFVLYHILNDYGKWGDLCRIFDVDFKDYSFTLIGNIFQNDLAVRK